MHIIFFVAVVIVVVVVVVVVVVAVVVVVVVVVAFSRVFQKSKFVTTFLPSNFMPVPCEVSSIIQLTRVILF